MTNTVERSVPLPNAAAGFSRAAALRIALLRITWLRIAWLLTRRMARRTVIARVCAACAATALAAGTGLLLTLHFLPATRDMSALSQPLSKYALTDDGAIFDAAVLAVALGLLALIGALRARRLARPNLILALSVSIVGLAVLVACPDQGFTPIGWLHWVGSMAAFGAVPLALICAHYSHRSITCSVLPRCGGWLAIIVVACFGTFLIGNVVGFTTEINVSAVGGLVERILSVAELTGAALLTVWGWRGCACCR